MKVELKECSHPTTVVPEVLPFCAIAVCALRCKRKTKPNSEEMDIL